MAKTQLHGCLADAPGVLFAGQGYEADLEKAWGCWRHLKTMFQELEECRAFELLKVTDCQLGFCGPCVACQQTRSKQLLRPDASLALRIFQRQPPAYT